MYYFVIIRITNDEKLNPEHQHFFSTNSNGKIHNNVPIKPYNVIHVFISVIHIRIWL